MIKFIRDWTLPLAMVLGAACYKIVGYIPFLPPLLIFCILLFTFSKISYKEIRISAMHLWLLLIEIGGAIALYYIVAPFDRVVAQGVMICFLCPTATAAAVVTSKLKGDVANVSTYTLLCNTAVAVVVPLLFPIIAPESSSPDFLLGFYTIMKKIFPLLILPFLIAQFAQKFMPKFNDLLVKCNSASFYLWALALVVSIGLLIDSMVQNPLNSLTVLYIAIGSLLSSIAQFYIGHKIGVKYNSPVAGTQGLGQKNTILAIWICNHYLNPISALAPGFYLFWQNIYNSYQMHRQRKLDNL